MNVETYNIFIRTIHELCNYGTSQSLSVTSHPLIHPNSVTLSLGCKTQTGTEQKAAKICVIDLTAEPGNYFTRSNSILFSKLKAKLKPINLPTEQGSTVQGVRTTSSALEPGLRGAPGRCAPLAACCGPPWRQLCARPCAPGEGLSDSKCPTAC